MSVATRLFSRDYPILPKHIDTNALVDGHLADYTVSKKVIAAIILTCGANWRPVSISAVERTYNNRFAQSPSHRAFDPIYYPFFTVEGVWVSITHECIVECFKKFPAASLEIRVDQTTDIS